MPKHGKKYRDAAAQIESEKLYTIDEAVALAKKTSATKFDATLEAHIGTHSDPKHADQIVRSTVVLPGGTGKVKKIAVFCEAGDEKAAKDAGADLVGSDDLIEEVAKGNIDFEIAIATPSMMKNLSKVAKVLGPKGLMPSPKSGTVTPDVAKAVEELKKGKIEFRNDKAGIIHTIFGKVSFSESILAENLTALIRSINDAKPEGVKGQLLKNISISASMGPGIKVELNGS